jgi:hypothetical protein
MGGECSAHEEVRNSTKFWLGSPKGRDYSEDLGVDGRIVLKWISGILGFGCVDWIHMAQHRDRCRVLVNTVMILRVT